MAGRSDFNNLNNSKGVGPSVDFTNLSVDNPDNSSKRDYNKFTYNHKAFLARYGLVLSLICLSFLSIAILSCILVLPKLNLYFQIKKQQATISTPTITVPNNGYKNKMAIAKYLDSIF